MYSVLCTVNLLKYTYYLLEVISNSSLRLKDLRPNLSNYNIALIPKAIPL